MVERLVEVGRKPEDDIGADYSRPPHIQEGHDIRTTVIDKNLTKLKERSILRRVGPDKGGHWEVVR